MPSVVKTSSSRLCATRPSITWARSTPPWTARRHASILGAMPESSVGRRSASSEARISAIRLVRSGQSANRPSTSVSTTSLSAPSATASAEAAVSAFTLSTWPSSATPMVEITGMKPSSSRLVTKSGRTPVTSPTSPRSSSCPSAVTVRRSAANRAASSPEMPTASGLWAFTSPTRSRCTWPVSTMRTTSMISGVVTRRPPRNSLVTPSRASIALIWGPPPCTTTGRRPASRRKTTSPANALWSSGEVIALPPYLTTTVAPRNRSSQGSASARTSALASASAVGTARDLLIGAPVLRWSRRSSRGRTWR